MALVNIVNMVRRLWPQHDAFLSFRAGTVLLVAAVLVSHVHTGCLRLHFLIHTGGLGQSLQLCQSISIRNHL